MRKYNAYERTTFAAVISYIAYGSASFFTFLQPPGHKDLYHERAHQASIAQVQTGVEILFHPKRRLRHRSPGRQTLSVSDSMYRCPYAFRNIFLHPKYPPLFVGFNDTGPRQSAVITATDAALTYYYRAVSAG